MPKLLLKFNTAVIKEIPFDKNEITVGRKPENDVVIDNPAVSGRHCRIVLQAGDYVLEDLNSTNGTFLHNRKVIKANLHDKDEVGVAKHVVVFINEKEAAAQAAQAQGPVSSDATVVMSAPSAAPKEQPAAKEEAKEKVGAIRIMSGNSTASQFTLTGLTTYIGKSGQAQIKLKGLFAPDIAACIARKPEGYYLKVVKDKTVKYNGAVLADQVLLNEGDLIEAGGLKMYFYFQDAGGPLSG